MAALMQEKPTPEARKLTRGDLISVFARMHLFQGTLNYERMEALGYAFVMVPVIRRLYKSREEIAAALKRHLEFFNTQTTVCSVIFGLTAAMEEQGGNDADRAIAGMKAGMMGPLAGIGDSLIWSTWMPICMSIGAAMALSGNFAGPIIAWLLFNLVQVPAKYYGVMAGYHQGSSVLSRMKGSLDSVTTLASIVGLMVVGSLIPNIVGVTTPAVVVIKDLTIKIQEILNSIMPNILPLGFTLFSFWLIRRRWSPLNIVLLLIAITLVLTAFHGLA